MNEIMGRRVDVMVRGVAADYLRLAKETVTNRKARVAIFACALRGALDELSPDERETWLKIALAELQR